MSSEPIGEWMRAQGFPPEKAYIVLPLQFEQAFRPCPPYVRFARLDNNHEALLCWDVIKALTPQLQRGDRT